MREWKIASHYPVKAKGRTLTGLVSTFGVRDSVDDVVQVSAFDRTIQERRGKVLFLWGHQMDQKPTAVIKSLTPVPRTALPTEILRDYPGATGGLLVEREYLLHESAQAAFEVAASTPIGMSYGYDPVRFSLHTAPDGVKERWLEEIRLWEVSDVNFPALSATIANLAAKGYKFAGGLGLERKRAPSVALLRAKLRLLDLESQMGIAPTPSMATLRTRMRTLRAEGLF